MTKTPKPPALPTKGGSYVRQENGALRQTAGPAVKPNSKAGKAPKAPNRTKEKES